MAYEKIKKLKERKIIIESNKEDKKFQNNKEGKTPLIKEDKVEDKKDKVRVCPICGEVLDERHKSNLLEENYKVEEQKMREHASKKLDGNMSQIEGHRKAEMEIYHKLGEEFSINAEELETAGVKEAHHIISINDVFFKNERLSKVLVSAGYDVNNEKNGIYLPSIIDQRKLGRKWTEEDSYRLMKSTARQRHKGPHQYEITSALREKNKSLTSYSELVNDELKRLESRMDLKCFLTEDDKKTLISQMNNKSQEIKRKIELFKKSPKECIYYVSKASMEYAFRDIQVKESVSIINIESIVREKNEIRATKFNLEKDDNQIKLKKGKDYVGVIDLSFIKFCGDSTMFIESEKLIERVEDFDFHKAVPIEEGCNIESWKSDREKLFQEFNFIKEKKEKLGYTIRELMKKRKENINIS